MYCALRFKKQDRIMMTTLLRKLWMNTMKLWKGTNNIAWLIEALLSSFLFFLFCSSPPFYLTHSSLPILLLFVFLFSPFYLSFLLVLFLLLLVSLLALSLYYLMPSLSSTLTFLSPSLPFLAGPVSPPSPSLPSITSCLLFHLLLLFSLPLFLFLPVLCPLLLLPSYPVPSITSFLLLHLLWLFSLPSSFPSCWSCFFSFFFAS